MLYAFIYVYCLIEYTIKDKAFDLRLIKMMKKLKLNYTKATYEAALRCLHAELSTC